MTEYPLFPAKTLEQIPVSDKPPRQKGIITHLTPKEFEDIYDCKYTENLWGTKEQADVYNDLWAAGLKNKDQLTQFEQDVLHRLNNPFQDFVISFINKEVGAGLFATKPIPAGTIIGVYSGQLATKSQANSKDLYIYSLEKGNDPKIISSQKLGGMARFLQHLPTNEKMLRAALTREFKQPENLAKRLNTTMAELKLSFEKNILRDSLIDELIEEELKTTLKAKAELDDIQFHPKELRKEIATANILACSITLLGCPMLVMYAPFPIEAEEHIGVSYNDYYWKTLNAYPELFTRDGLMLNHAHYKRSKVYLKFTDPTNKQRKLPMENDVSVFIEDIKCNKPIYAVISKQQEIPLSIYDLRDKLVKANAVDDRYGALSNVSLPDFLNKELNSRFSDIRIKAYLQQPTVSPAKPQRQVIDIICKVADATQLSKLQSFFSPLKGDIAVFQETNEIVIIDINKIKDQITQFSLSLQNSNQNNSLALAKELYKKACDKFTQGEYTEATSVFLQTSALHENGSKEQATCFYSLASCYIKQDNYAKAIEFATKAVELRDALLKDNEIQLLDLERAQTKLSNAKKLEEADKLAKIALKCFNNGQYDEAIKSFISAGDTHKSVQAESVKLSIYYYNLSSSYDHLNMHKEAKEYCQLAYDLRIKLLGSDNEYTKKAADKLSVLENKLHPVTIINNNSN